jgi:hypothetical protein
MMNNTKSQHEVYHPYRDSKTGEDIPLSTRAGGWIVLGANSMNLKRTYDENVPCGCAFLSSDSGISYLSNWKGNSNNKRVMLFESREEEQSSIDLLAADLYAKEITRHRCCTLIQMFWRRRDLSKRVMRRLRRKRFFQDVKERTMDLRERVRAARCARCCAGVAWCAVEDVRDYFLFSSK